MHWDCAIQLVLREFNSYISFLYDNSIMTVEHKLRVGWNSRVISNIMSFIAA